VVDFILDLIFDKPMKILIVSQYFWPEHFVVNSLGVELKKRGHEVQVLTGLPNYPQGNIFSGFSFWRGPWQQDYEGVSIHRVPLLPRRKGFFNLALNYLSFVVFGIFPGAFLVKKDFDIIFCMGLSPVTLCLPAIFLKKLTSKPLIFWVQDLWPESVTAVGATKSGLALSFIGKVVRFIYRRCDRILVQSRAFHDSVIRWGGEAPRIQYVPNWAKLPPLISKLPSWLEDLPQGFKIIFAGNIGQAQDMPTILGAAERLKMHADIRWLIVGDGSAKEFVDQEILKRQLANSVHTYGRRPSEDMPALLSVGDVMLVTLTDEHIFSLTVPSKVQGYMASAKPILAALNGEGARVVTEAQAGLTCPAENPQALAEKVLELYKMSSTQRHQLGQNGLEYFKSHFEESLVIGQIENACIEVARDRQSKGSL